MPWLCTNGLKTNLHVSFQRPVQQAQATCSMTFINERDGNCGHMIAVLNIIITSLNRQENLGTVVFSNIDIAISAQLRATSIKPARPLQLAALAWGSTGYCRAAHYTKVILVSINLLIFILIII